MIIELLIGQLFLALFNIANSHIDAYRILKNKTIAHGVNFGAYLLLVSVLCFLLSIPINVGVPLFFASAFFNRQFTFDIPLNIRRGLEWYYQSKDNPPKALLDKIEKWFLERSFVKQLFKRTTEPGIKLFKIYLTCYCVVVILWIWRM